MEITLHREDVGDGADPHRARFDNVRRENCPALAESQRRTAYQAQARTRAGIANVLFLDLDRACVT
jgi:hypothetical protein